MKKIIFIILSLISLNVYSQSCPGISGTGIAKSKGTTVCYDTVKVTSYLNTVIADTFSCTKATIGGVTIANPPGGTTTFLRGDGTFAVPSGATSGTVTTVSVATANGVSGSVANATTTPAITLTLGAITPSTVNGVMISGSSTPTLAVTGTTTISGTHSGASSGTNTGDQINITGNAATVTTNANLTGPITSSGNATSIASQTGTGTTFAMSANPTFTGTITSPSHTQTGNITTSAWGTTGIAFKATTNTYTDNSSSGTVATSMAINSILSPSIAASSITSYTGRSSTLYIEAPTAGTNVNLNLGARAIYASGILECNNSIFTPSVGGTTTLNILSGTSTRTAYTTAGLQTHTTDIVSSGTAPQWTMTQSAHTGGTQRIMLVNAGALTSQATATEVTDVNYNLSAVAKIVDGTIATQRSFIIQGRTLTPQTSALTVTSPITLEVNPPIAGSGTTFTNRPLAIRSTGDISVTGTNSTFIHVVGGGSAPTIAAGTGAGTSPTVSVGSGSTDLAGYVNVTTGTLPTLSGTVATITFNTAYTAAPHCIMINAANGNSAILSGASMVFVNQAGITTTTFAITAGTTALIGATAYQFFYQVIQ